ncbi:class IV lanthionine synthetase LanL [Actinomadura madurae]|uniref:class IV lanthionine synthetase LanL n=2 Tax=Actinomadura madurae TaxID=1993 RepID=UPI0020D1F62B|nr:class IV lanthionine synthetase LanL [Actinomadura madurae]
MATSSSDSADTLVFDVLEHLASIAHENGREIVADDTWVSVHDPRFDIPAQGWKLHVSARPGTLAATLDRVLPVLLGTACDFKAARSAAVLSDLNSGDGDAGAVGKAVTVYPAPDEVTALGHALAEALAGMAGPRIVSDRRVRPDAPVYYRYAPFLPQYKVDENGEFSLIVVGPSGDTLPGAAGAEFTCPPWATDPFRSAPSEAAAASSPATSSPATSSPATSSPATSSPATQASAASAEAGSAAAKPGRMIGGRYRVTSGVMRGPRGSVYRAEAPDGRPVIVKEARAYVGERPEGFDLRMYLRNELRILRALTGIPGVPEALDHFRHGEDEYLVMTDAGTTDLNRHVAESGVYSDGDLTALASRILEVLDAVHERGVVVRDLSPKNIVVEDGRCTLIDFGTSGYEDLQMPGWSRGFSVPDQRTGRPSTPADDYFSLGATLFYAATGLNPVIIDPDPVRGVERTLQCLSRIFPNPTGTVALLHHLLSLDPTERTSAAESIRTGGEAPTPRPYAPPIHLTDDLLSAVLAHTTREVVGYAERLMEGPADARRSAPPVTNVYAGSAGVGMELLQHPEARAMGLDLAHWTAANLPPTNLPPSLYFGLTGTAIFLTTAGVPSPGRVELTGEERADQAHGLAGIGTGHLLLASLTPDGDHLATATECARRLLARRLHRAGRPPRTTSGLRTIRRGLGRGHRLRPRRRRHSRLPPGPPPRHRRHRLRRRCPRTLHRPGQVSRSPDRRAGLPSGRPMGASWCQGMSGVATALLHAASAYNDDTYLSLATRIADACTQVAPRAWVTSQCCGLAGIGEALIDVAVATDDNTYWHHAEQIAELMLIRAGGPHEAPTFPGNDLDTQAFTWATGTAGVLTFLRRLTTRTPSRLWHPGSAT